MSGATRNERRRRQVATAGSKPAIGRIPGSGANSRVKVGVIVAVVIIAVFAVAYVVLSRHSETAQPSAASYPVSANGVVVTAGKPSAPMTIDIYEDYLCPYCERFEARSGADLTKALNAGQIKVNYHALNILDTRTVPPGYSTLAANAALCAVPAGIWPAFHARLYADQPAEGSAGLTRAQLTNIGTQLGAGQGFGACVSGNANASAITAATAAAAANPALQTDGQFGTPTVAVGGHKIDVSSSDWLSTVLGAR